MKTEIIEIQAMAGATPMTVADAVIRECPDKDLLEDVVFYINTYISREWGRKNEADN